MVITETSVWDHLEQLQDPMFGEPLSVVDVGMIDGVRLTPATGGIGTAVLVRIRMFNRGRVHIDAAASPVRRHMLALDGVADVSVEVVWDEPWTPDRLSERARQVLGFAADDPVEGAMHVRAATRADVNAEPVNARHLDTAPLHLGAASSPLQELSRDRLRPYWGGWRLYKRFALTESAGHAREHEPIHLHVHFAAGQVRDAVREVRIVVADSGQELPCQVYAVDTADGDTHCRVMFFANCAGHDKREFLLLHDNPSPACWSPFYPSDLVTRGQGVALQIDNGIYRTRLSPVMGHLRNLEFCRWGGTKLGWDNPSPLSLVDADNDPGSKLDIAWHGEDDCIHWNPDFRNQLRYRMTNWPQAPNWTVDRGDLCTIVHRWGYPVCPTHPARDQTAVRLDVTYTFYDALPYFTMTSSLTVEQEADILVVRNDEWLFRQAFSHAVHMHADGAMAQTMIQTPAADNMSFERNPAIVGFVDETSRDAFVTLRLAFDARGFPGAYDPAWLTLGTTDYGNQLWSRDVFHERQEMAIQPGAFVSETNAYLCFHLDEGGLDQASHWYDLLRRPLHR